MPLFMWFPVELFFFRWVNQLIGLVSFILGLKKVFSRVSCWLWGSSRPPSYWWWYVQNSVIGFFSFFLHWFLLNWPGCKAMCLWLIILFLFDSCWFSSACTQREVWRYHCWFIRPCGYVVFWFVMIHSTYSEWSAAAD